MNDPEFRPVWENRRRVIFISLAFCAGIITYLTGWGADTRLNETLAQFSFIAALSIAGSYIFGAAWEDVTRLRK